MEGASATRLRFKESPSASSRKRSSGLGSASNTHGPSGSTSHHKSRRPASSRSRSRSRSRSPRRSSRRDHNHHTSRHRSKKRHRHRDTPRPPRRTAPDTYSDYFDNGLHETNEGRFREEEATAQGFDEQEQDPWLAHLFDELSNDDPLEYHSSRFESMYHNVGRGTGSGFGYASKYDHLNGLSDERYADYMRRGMSGRDNHRSSAAQKEDKEWAEWVRDQEEIKYRQERDKQRAKDERARQRREERRKEKEKDEATSKNSMDSATNALRKKGVVDKARKSYEQGWSALMDGKTSVSEDTVPWPPSAASESNTPATTEHVGISLYEFLFLGTPTEETNIRRQLLRREQLKFHPDKFKQRFGTRLPMNAASRQAVLDRVERVAQELNEIGELL